MVMGAKVPIAMQLEFTTHFSMQGCHGDSSLKRGNAASSGNTETVITPFSVPFSAEPGSFCGSNNPSFSAEHDQPAPPLPRSGLVQQDRGVRNMS